MSEHFLCLSSSSLARVTSQPLLCFFDTGTHICTCCRLFACEIRLFFCVLLIFCVNRGCTIQEATLSDNDDPQKAHLCRAFLHFCAFCSDSWSSLPSFCAQSSSFCVCCFPTFHSCTCHYPISCLACFPYNELYLISYLFFHRYIIVSVAKHRKSLTFCCSVPTFSQLHHSGGEGDDGDQHISRPVRWDGALTETELQHWKQDWPAWALEEGAEQVSWIVIKTNSTVVDIEYDTALMKGINDGSMI